MIRKIMCWLGWHADYVDWSDVKKVIQDQIDCVGYRETVDFNEDPEIVSIEHE